MDYCKELHRLLSGVGDSDLMTRIVEACDASGRPAYGWLLRVAWENPAVFDVHASSTGAVVTHRLRPAWGLDLLLSPESIELRRGAFVVESITLTNQPATSNQQTEQQEQTP